MNDVVTSDVVGNIGVISVDSPPVNALGIAVRRGLDAELRRFADDPCVEAIVIICGGRTFFAGADISEFDQPPQSPTLYDILEALAAADKPVVAAIHGSALGGGLEVALACDFRIAVPSARFGLPEIKLGLMPGGGGTQRLPRLIGLEKAFDMISTGRVIPADEAATLGLIDGLAGTDTLRADSITLAREAALGTLPVSPSAGCKLAELRDYAEAFAALCKVRRREGSRKAQDAILEALQAAVTLPLDEGLARERVLFADLRASAESRALRHVFFAEREASKVSGVSLSEPPAGIRQAGVVGAGTMGTGIALAMLDAGLPVILTDADAGTLERAIGTIRKFYQAHAAKGRIPADQPDAKMALLRTSPMLDDLREVDLVIEAAFEDMTVKRNIFAGLDRIVKPGAILASNTSFLDLDEIAQATGRPERVVGLHFFSPANVMRLLEVVRGRATEPAVIAEALQFAKRIGKAPVVSKVCRGFIANRIMSQRGAQANALVLDGATPAEVDRIMTAYGFPMGHFQMIDLAGLDVLGRGQTERTLYSDFVAKGRLGQKSKAGFYDYGDDRSARPSPVAAEIIAEFARFKEIEPLPPASDQELLFRLLLPVVNEGARVLEEGIAERSSDIDVAAILGYGWPAETGGPMFWADQIGLRFIVGQLEALSARFGDAFKPAQLLVDLAKADASFANRDRHGASTNGRRD